MKTAALDYGTVPAWISALTPLLVAGMLTRTIKKTTRNIKDAIRTGPRTLRQRRRAARRTTHVKADHRPSDGG